MLDLKRAVANDAVEVPVSVEDLTRSPTRVYECRRSAAEVPVRSNSLFSFEPEGDTRKIRPQLISDSQ